MELTLKHQDGSKKMRIALKIVIILLLLLWIPVGIDKLTSFDDFRNGMMKQPLSDQLGSVLIYLLPPLEIFTAFALITEKYRKLGLLLSTALMTAFTAYIAAALLGAWEELPCGCGSVIDGMNWKQHFFFNLFFICLSIVGLYLWYKLRSGIAGSEAIEGGSAKRQIKNILNIKI